jgi:hypothetical protein
MSAAGGRAFDQLPALLTQKAIGAALGGDSVALDRLPATVSLRPGESLFREGDTADALYIVL